jgi:hypothetical protein
MKASRSLIRRVIAEVLEDEKQLDHRAEIASIYSDVYKEKFGVRARHMRWDEMSTEQMNDALEKLYAEEGDKRDYGDRAPEEVVPEYPDNEGTVTDPLPASVRSGGRVRLGDPDDGPGERVSRVVARR